MPRGLSRFAKRSAMRVGGWGRTPVGSGRNPMQFTNRKGTVMSRSEVGRSGMYRMGGGVGGATVIGLSNRRSSSGRQGM